MCGAISFPQWGNFPPSPNGYGATSPRLASVICLPRRSRRRFACRAVAEGVGGRDTPPPRRALGSCRQRVAARRLLRGICTVTRYYSRPCAATVCRTASARRWVSRLATFPWCAHTNHDPFCFDHCWLVCGCYWCFQKTECMVGEDSVCSMWCAHCRTDSPYLPTHRLDELAR